MTGNEAVRLGRGEKVVCWGEIATVVKVTVRPGSRVSVRVRDAQGRERERLPCEVEQAAQEADE